MKYITSCSNGKDSLAMVLTLLEKNAPLDHVVFIDTGKEFKSIYKVWEKLSLILGKAGIEHSKITTDKTFDYYFLNMKFIVRMVIQKMDILGVVEEHDG